MLLTTAVINRQVWPQNFSVLKPQIWTQTVTKRQVFRLKLDMITWEGGLCTDAGFFSTQPKLRFVLCGICAVLLQSCQLPSISLHRNHCPSPVSVISCPYRQETTFFSWPYSPKSIQHSTLTRVASKSICQINVTYDPSNRPTFQSVCSSNLRWAEEPQENPVALLKPKKKNPQSQN